MNARDGPNSVSQVLDCMLDDVDGDRVTLEEILKRLGTRSYGPGMCLLAVISMLPPISWTPGLPLITGLGTIALAVQLFMLRPYPWVPRRLCQISFARATLDRTFSRAREWARQADKMIRPRLKILVVPPFLNLIALNCIGLAVLTIVLSILPAGENVPAAAILLFGLALTVGDGLLALIGLAVTAITIASLVYFWPTLFSVYVELTTAVGS